MDSENQPKGSVKELFNAFSHPLSSFWRKIIDYVNTSIAILGFGRLPQQINNPEKSYLKDVDYGVVTFEFLLIFLFVTKILNIGSEMDELLEGLRDFLVLVLFFIALLVFIGISRIWQAILGLKTDRRNLDAFFIYEFNFLFLPSYLVLYPVYLSYSDDDDMIGGVIVLLGFFWLVHMMFYFVKLCRFLKIKTFPAIMTGLIIPSLGFILLFLSVAMVVGVSVGE